MEISGQIEIDAVSAFLLPNGRQLNKNYLGKKTEPFVSCWRNAPPNADGYAESDHERRVHRQQESLFCSLLVCFVCLFVFLNLTKNFLMFSPMQMFTLFEHSEADVTRPDRPFSLFHCAKHSFIENRISQCVAKHCCEKILRLSRRMSAQIICSFFNLRRTQLSCVR